MRCATWASAAMSSLVAVASAAALRTTSFVCASRRLISLIEADSSSAAAAAVSTLAEASFDPCTAPSARCSVWSDVVSRVLAAGFIAAALCPTDLDDVLDPAAEGSDIRVDRDAALLAHAERIALLLGGELLGDVGMRLTQPPPRSGRWVNAMMRPSSNLDHFRSVAAFGGLA